MAGVQTTSPRVLFVEDDKAIRDLVSFHLNIANFSTTTLADGREALDVVMRQPFDVILLDVVLPGMDGITLCESIRHDGPNREVPILMLTARREESDKVEGLTSGADDYLTKPFGMRELLARVQALLRRPKSTWRSATPARELPVVSALGVVVDPSRRRVTCDKAIVQLTPHEFKLLYLLVSNPGVVFDREELLARVWAGELLESDRVVDALVKRLRRKIETDHKHPRRLITVWGSGYKFGDS
jgi:two-component system, OmpR family, alkaline phosphatase synthesis response regulator PhoP